MHSATSYRLVRLARDVYSVHSLAHQETFHPVIGPVAEAEALYVKQLRLPERIRPHAGEFVIWDVGLGAAANPLSVLRATRDLTCSLHILSFDQTLGPLAFALKNADALEYLNGYEERLSSLLKNHQVEFLDGTQSVKWEFFRGDFPALVARTVSASSEPAQGPPHAQHTNPPLPQGEGRGEGEQNRRPTHRVAPASPHTTQGPPHAHRPVPPLPQGEGRGEGEQNLRAIHRVALASPLSRISSCADRFPPPHVIMFDAYSPATNSAMWTLPLFTNMYRLLDPQRPCAMPTYSRSTLLRVTLLLAGFWVGVGHATGEKEETTIAANSLGLIDEPLDRRWLARARRSTSAEPLREPVYRQARLSAATWEKLQEHPQFSLPGLGSRHQP